MGKPKVLVSACLLGLPYRYNGEIIENHRIKSLDSYLELIPICPEVETGLGVPRFPIKLINTKKGIKMVQTLTKADVTSNIKKFARKITKKFFPFYGVIVKSKSPSCALNDCKVYDKNDSNTVIYKHGGIFTTTIKKRFFYIPIISENADESSLDEFLIKVFLLYNFEHMDINKFNKEFSLLLKAFYPHMHPIKSRYDLYRIIRYKLNPTIYVEILKRLIPIPDKLSFSFKKGEITRITLVRELKSTYEVKDTKLKRYLEPYPLYNT